MSTGNDLPLCREYREETSEASSEVGTCVKLIDFHTTGIESGKFEKDLC